MATETKIATGARIEAFILKIFVGQADRSLNLYRVYTREMRANFCL